MPINEMLSEESRRLLASVASPEMIRKLDEGLGVVFYAENINRLVFLALLSATQEQPQ